MPNEMIERVARALAKSDGVDPDYRKCGIGIPKWERYVGEARAAIEAMREPTQEMLFDGQINLGAGGELDNENLKEVWGLMIDAALNE